MKPRNWLVPLALLPLLLMVACGLAPRLEPPELRVVDVRVLRADILQQQLRVRLHVQNPNDRELRVRGITYVLQVAGEQIAEGDSDRDFVVPALGGHEFDVNVTANAAPLLLRYATGSRRGPIEYRLVGKVQLAAGLVRSVPFEHSGTLDLSL